MGSGIKKPRTGRGLFCVLWLWLLAFFLHLLEQIHEVNLTTARYLRCPGNVAFTAGTDARTFLYLHPPGFDAALRGHVLRAAALVQVAIGTQPLEETILAHVIASSLLDELRHFTDEDRGLRNLDGFRKHHLWPVSRSLHFKGLTLFPFFLEIGSQTDEGIRIQQRLLQLARGQVAAVLADGGQDFVTQPTTELL